MVVFADRAVFGLLRAVWRTGADLAAGLPAVLEHLRTLAEPLTRTAGPPGGSSKPPAPASTDAGPTGLTNDGAGGGEELAGGLPGSLPAVCALDCVLEYAASRATADGEMPSDILDLVAHVMADRPGDEAVAAAIGGQLPVLHRRPPRAVRPPPPPVLVGCHMAAPGQV
ncbi:hypothetical protein [Streptomyces decoyicus]|uniref:hypothetical protein n=1 Tax=Streptomyces decoyicus TaxID=249567 RepID=UPI003658A225